jgi:hypothetical protein
MSGETYFLEEILRTAEAFDQETPTSIEDFFARAVGVDGKLEVRASDLVAVDELLAVREPTPVVFFHPTTLDLLRRRCVVEKLRELSR